MAKKYELQITDIDESKVYESLSPSQLKKLIEEQYRPLIEERYFADPGNRSYDLINIFDENTGKEVSYRIELVVKIIEKKEEKALKKAQSEGT